MRNKNFKGKLILLTVLVTLFGLFIAAKFFFLDKQNEFGSLKVLSSPSSTVFLDNVAVGKTTPFEDRVKIGEYMIKLIPQGEATQTASWQGRVKIYKNALTYVNRELGSSDVTSAGEVFTVVKMETAPKNKNYGEIYIETDPLGAIVYLDNDEKGVAPVLLADVIQGTHELSIFMPGFFRRTQKINIDAGYRVNAQIKLAIDQSQKRASDSGKLKEDKTSTESASQKSLKEILIKDTPTGFLRVREEPNIIATEAAQVKPGDRYSVIEEQNSWYKIEYEEGKEGWISSEYAETTQ
ncbi:hypothetical protein A3B50_01760 [Candidatus Roizmanbacteria bacterium RIFCSPLOWO2_01_FULL_40_42]|uniref:SH3b domain-containing protein n=1 Tax=Candidatus Roizmanbacteria bacterium RIFCSPLOWO2_01_FULL_40_42 TaxID=1802066 RepID=A0A1F7J4F8_9BACT|nr:MAG: hypothetical protein A3B50_01760 [Candidatus Roizmanbacteria bacterium RIFCSPLOWO2_01_FULL_40_42]